MGESEVGPTGGEKTEVAKSSMAAAGRVGETGVEAFSAAASEAKAGSAGECSVADRSEG